MTYNRGELLERLKLLLPSQFEEVLFNLSIDVWHLPASGASQAERAIALIRLLEQKESGFGHLQKLLDDINYFKDFVPKGAYPVGQKLLEREESRERQAMKEAEMRGEDPEDYRVTPEKFYTFRPDAAWLGVFYGWDSPRSFHSNILQRVIRTSHGQDNCPAAAIIGPGGSGKSVSLRRLAIDLANKGYKVWWIEEPELFIQFGLSQLMDTGDASQFLMIDEIQSIENEYVRRFLESLRKNRSFVLVIAGRKVPTIFHARLKPGINLFEPNEATDLVAILGKIAKTIPAWSDVATQLAVEPLRAARLIRILLVLARQKAAPRNMQELETTFLEILANDISKIRSMQAGLAEAVIDAAAIQEVGRYISRETLIALADYHQREAAIPMLLAEIDGNPRWKALTPLLSYDPEYDNLWFHHDELVVGLILAGQQGLLGSRVTGDDAWRRATLEVVMRFGSDRSKSVALHGFVCNRPALISKERVVEYIQQLLADGNSHHAYLRLIIDELLALEQHERFELLLSAARVAPYNTWLWSSVGRWIQLQYRGKESRCEVLETLYQAGCRSGGILNPLLKCLPILKAKTISRKLLKDKSTHPAVLCQCLDLLGEDAKDEAEKLLKESKIPEVLCTCLTLLGTEAKKEAMELLTDKSTQPEVLCSCLDLLGVEAKKKAKELLTNKSTQPEVLCSCLDLLGVEAKKKAKELLTNKSTHPSVLCTCLNLLSVDAKEEAKRLLKESKDQEVLCTCLNLLGEDAKEEAKRLLKESKDKEVLCTCLNLLSMDAKEEAKRLLKESKDKEVLCTCLNLLGVEAKKEAMELLTDKSTQPEVLCSCLDLLGVEAKKKAKELLTNKSTHPSVLCTCLNLLSVDAKEEAKRLLKESKDKEVLCTCLNLLGEDAKPFAVEQIRCWTEIEPALLVRCFQVAGVTPEAHKAATEMLDAWDKFISTRLRVVALRAPFDTPLRVQRALEVLDDWKRQSRPLVAAALMVFWNKPDTVTRYCSAILSKWHQEILYRHKHHNPEYDGHIIKALTHPTLRQEALKAAQEMLSEDLRSPGFLSVELRHQVENIMQGQWPLWSAPEDIELS